MKKKILVGFLSLCLCVISLFGLTACSNPLSMPDRLDVTSNGGAVVRVGDYIYFVNGYVDISKLEYGANRKNITQGAIYRVKLGENNSLEYDENGNMKGAEKVADNIAGFSSLNLFVYDSYIYYSTPFAEADKQGNTQFNRTVIKRVRLNGEKDENLYISTSTSPITWSVNKIITKENNKTSENIIVSVLDGTNLVSVNVTQDSTKTIAKNVESVVFPMVKEYNPNSKSSTLVNEQYVYYTRTDSGINGNAIYRANIKTAIEESSPVINENNGTKYKLVSFQKHDETYKLYYSKTNSDVTDYYGTEVDSEGKVLFSSATKQYTSSSYTQVEFTVSGRDEAIVVCETNNGDGTNNQIHFVNGIQTRAEVDANITILAVDESFIYGYNSNNELVKIGLDASHEQIVIANFANEKDDEDNEIEDGKEAYYSAGIKSDKSNKSLFVDFDGDYMYFFRTFKNNDGKENIYLARVNTNPSIDEIEIVDNVKISKAEVETVGQMEEGHKYTISETDSANE